MVTLIAGFDFLYQKFEFHKSMRMSKQDIKDEMKQTEGDPIIKARLRQLRIERSRKRMMAAVPEADVVITNPTHYAVALKYTSGEMAAPVVVAKGVDTIALRIREVAKENDVPIVENPPLARAIHGGVEIDQAIPETYYRAVAEVIGYVWRLKGKRRAAPVTARWRAAVATASAASRPGFARRSTWGISSRSSCASSACSWAAARSCGRSSRRLADHGHMH